MAKIPYINLGSQWAEEKEGLLPILDKVLSSGQYIGGKEVELLEERISELCGSKFCIALNSGTDALVCGLAAMGIRRGDEVITPPNSFVASTAAIVHIGAKPVFVDVLPDQNIDPEKISKAITPKTKAIMPVHLTGRMSRMDEIQQIANDFNVKVIEDSAQAIGSKYLGIQSGKWGDIGCFSTHPLKNLNACGDGGLLVTDDQDIATQIRLMRTHGLIDRNTVAQFGFVSRMDALQAAILNYRLDKLDVVISKRRENAAQYMSNLNPEAVYIAPELSKEFNTYHTFVIQVQKRDALQKYLADLGIETSIHYPIPIHLQPAAAQLGYKLGDFPVTELQSTQILTLPVNQFITSNQIQEICGHINKFYE